MKLHLNATRLVLILAITAIAIGFSAFRQKDSPPQNAFRERSAGGDEDTTTRRKRDRLKAEYNMDEVEQSMKNLDEQMIELDLQLNKMDFSKIQKEVEDAMNKIDMKNIDKEIELALKKVDWDKIRSEVNVSIDEVKKIDMGKMKKELAEIKIELQKLKTDVKIDGAKIKQQVEEGMKNAKEEIAIAKDELKNIKLLTDTLHKDGLIDKNKAYKVELKDGELYLNGAKQPKEVTDKYRSYFKKGNFTIHSDGGKKGESI